MERNKAVKLIAGMMLAIMLSFSLVVALPSFSITSKAAENNIHLDAVSAKPICPSLGIGSSGSVQKFNIDLSSYTIKEIHRFQLVDYSSNEKMYVSYSPFTYSLLMRAYKTTGGYAWVDQPQVSNLLSGVKPYLCDSLGNKYSLDVNGGVIEIDNASNIKWFTIIFTGSLSGTFDFQPSGASFSSFIVNVDLSSLDITVSSAPPVRTITDSEGTVWTVPDEVENPVVYKSGDSKRLIDGVPGLGYFVDNIVYGGAYILASETNDLPTLYSYTEDGTRESSPIHFNNSTAEFFGIEPIYCSSIPVITEFVYGSLPEIEVTPLPVESMITDSEGTVWTVPDEVENPVVYKSGDSKRLIDGVPGLGYFVDNIVYGGAYILASETNDLPTLYSYTEDGTRESSPIPFNNSTAEFFGIEPIYCSSIPVITEFVYGSLPEIEVTPLPVESPEPSPEPSQDELRILGDVKIGDDVEAGYLEETDINVLIDYDLLYTTKWGEIDSDHVLEGTTKCHGVYIEDYIPKYLGAFRINTKVDGYISMEFPSLQLFPELVWPNVTDSLTELTDEKLVKLYQEYVEPIVYIHANGQKYKVNHHGGRVRIPVNAGYNHMIFEVGLYVKDDFWINQDSSFNAIYKVHFSPFTVTIRDYQDAVSSAVEDIKETLENQLEESKKQTDALTKYENADKMDSDNDKLTGAIGDYNEISDSLFESAGGSMSDFDLGSAFEYSSSLIAAFGFLATVITSIIQQMGWYSILYPIGIALVIIGALLGLSKYMSSAGPGEMPKDEGVNHPYHVDPTQERLPDHGKK